MDPTGGEKALEGLGKDKKSIILEKGKEILVGDVGQAVINLTPPFSRGCWPWLVWLRPSN